MGLSDQLKSSSARTPALILAVLVVLGLGLATVAAFRSGDPETVSSQVVRASPRDPTTTSSTLLDATAGASTTSTSTPSAAIPSVPGAPGIGGPTRNVVPTTAGVVPVETTAAPPPEPSTQCTPAQADQTLAADKSTYVANEIVTVTATIRNHSTTSCTIANPDTGCYALLTAFVIPDNNAYWRSGRVPSGPCSPLPRRTLFPGQVATFSATWDQSDRRGCRADNSDPGCGKPRVVGLYTIHSGWLGAPKTTLLTLQ